MYKKSTYFLSFVSFVSLLFVLISNANTNTNTITITHTSTNTHKKLLIITPIKPIAQITKLITKDKAIIKQLIDKNVFAHIFSPKPSQLKYVQKADLYISIGLEFEHKLIYKFKKINKNLNIVKAYQDVIPIQNTQNTQDENEHENEHSNDPHIWTSPKKLIKIATNIYKQIIIKDSKNKIFYTNNYNKLINKIQKIDTKFKKLSNIAFVSSNNVWQYLAKEYNYEMLKLGDEHKKSNMKTTANSIKTINQRNKNNSNNSKPIYKIILADEREDIKMVQMISKNTNIGYIVVNPTGDIFKAFNSLLKAFGLDIIAQEISTTK